MEKFWADVEAQQRLIESNPQMQTFAIVLQIVFFIVGFFLARKVFDDAKLSGRNGMLWAGLVFFSWSLLGILGAIPTAIFYMTNKQRGSEPLTRPVSDAMIKCPSCNYAKNPSDALICGLCGRPLPEPSSIMSPNEKKCLSCNDINPATNKFCKNCGKQL